MRAHAQLDFLVRRLWPVADDDEDGEVEIEEEEEEEKRRDTR